MPKPYSLDLRERAIARVEAGETVRSVAAVLQISPASVVKWSQRHRRTGSAAPGPMHGHRPKILLAHRDWIVERTGNGQAFTLRGLQGELAERGVKVDYRTVWNFVHDQGLTFKKKRAAKRTGSARHCPQARVLAKTPGPG
jgi:putative transposase